MSSSRRKLICITGAVLAVLLLLFALSAVAVFADESDGEEELGQNISDLLDGLDLTELEQYLDENSDSYLFNFGDTAREIIEYLINGNAGIDNSVIRVIFKIIGIGYIVELTAASIKDLGFESISDKLIMCGRIMIFLVSVPVLKSLYEVIVRLIELV